jgi:hypothetical protein
MELVTGRSRVEFVAKKFGWEQEVEGDLLTLTRGPSKVTVRTDPTGRVASATVNGNGVRGNKAKPVADLVLQQLHRA